MFFYYCIYTYTRVNNYGTADAATRYVVMIVALILWYTLEGAAAYYTSLQ